MVKKEDIYLEDNKLRIKENKKYSNELRNFFNFYQDNFSWEMEEKKKQNCLRKD